MSKHLLVAALLLGALAVHFIESDCYLSPGADTQDDNARRGSLNPFAHNSPTFDESAHNEAIKKEIEDKLGVFADLDTIFEDSDPHSLEGAFKRLGNSLKQVGEQFKAGLAKLTNDSRVPKIDMKNFKGLNMPAVNGMEDKTGIKKTTGSSMKGITETNHRVHVPRPLSHKTGSFNGDNGVHTRERAVLEELERAKTDNTTEKKESLLEKLRAFSKFQAAHQRHTRGKNISEEIQRKQENDANLSEQGENSNTENVTNVLNAIDEAFGTKDMETAFRNMITSLENIGNQMKVNIGNLQKGMQTNFPNYKYGFKNNTGEPRMPVKRDTNSHQDSNDLQKIKDLLDKTNAIFNQDKIKVGFSRFKDKMKEIEMKIRESLEDLNNTTSHTETTMSGLSNNKGTEIHNSKQEGPIVRDKFADTMHSKSGIIRALLNPEVQKNRLVSKRQDGTAKHSVASEKNGLNDNNIESKSKERKHYITGLISKKVMEDIARTFDSVNLDKLNKPWEDFRNVLNKMSELFSLSIHEATETLKAEIDTQKKQNGEYLVSESKLPIKETKESSQKVMNDTGLNVNTSRQDVPRIVKVIDDRDFVSGNEVGSSNISITDRTVPEENHKVQISESETQELNSHGEGFNELMEQLNESVRKAQENLEAAKESMSKHLGDSRDLADQAMKGFSKAVRDADRAAEEALIVASKTKYKIERITQHLHNSREKRQATDSLNNENAFHKVLQVFHNISKITQPENLEFYIRDTKGALNRWRENITKIARIFRDELKLITFAKPVTMQKWETSVENIQHFLTMMETAFDQFDKEFEDVLKEAVMIKRGIKSSIGRIEWQTRIGVHSSEKTEELGDIQKEYERSYSKVMGKLEKIQFALDPNHVSDCIKRLNENIEMTEAQIHSQMEDFRYWTKNYQQTFELEKRTFQHEESRALPTPEKDEGDEITKLIHKLSPEDLENAFNDLSTKIKDLDKKIKGGLTNIMGYSETINQERLEGPKDDIKQVLGNAETNLNTQTVDSTRKGRGIVNRPGMLENSRAAIHGHPESATSYTRNEPEKNSITPYIDKAQHPSEYHKLDILQREIKNMQESLKGLKMMTEVVSDPEEVKAVLRRIVGSKDLNRTMAMLKDAFDIKEMDHDINAAQRALQNIRANIDRNFRNNIELLLKDHDTARRSEDSSNDMSTQRFNHIKDLFKPQAIHNKLKGLQKDVDDVKMKFISGLRSIFRYKLNGKYSNAMVTNTTFKRDVLEVEKGPKTDAFTKTLDQMLADIDTVGIRKSVSNFEDAVRGTWLNIDSGFSKVKGILSQHLTTAGTELTTEDQALLQNLRQTWTLNQAKVRRTNSEITHKLNNPQTLDDMNSLKQKVEEIQNYINVSDLDDMFYRLSNRLHHLNSRFEIGIQAMGDKLNLTGILDEGGSTGHHFTMSQLKQSFNSSEINRTFTELREAMINAAGKLHNWDVDSSTHMSKRVELDAPRWHDFKSPKSKVIGNPGSVRKMDEVANIFNVGNIKDTFERLNNDINTTDEKFERGLEALGKSIQGMINKGHPFSARQDSFRKEEKKQQFQSNDIEGIGVVLSDLNPTDLRHTFEDASQKVMKLGDIFKSGIKGISKTAHNEISNEVTQGTKSQKSVPGDEAKRTIRQPRSIGKNFNDKGEGERSEGEMGNFIHVNDNLRPGGIDNVMELLKSNVRRIEEKAYARLGNMRKSALKHNENHRNTLKEIEKAFNMENVTKGFNEVYDALRTINNKVKKRETFASVAVDYLKTRQQEVKAIWQTQRRQLAVGSPQYQTHDRIYQGMIDALEKVKSAFSPEVTRSGLLKLNDDIITAEEAVDDGLTKTEDWFAQRMHESKPKADIKYHLLEDALKREITSRTKDDKKVNDRIHEDDIEKVGEALTPEKFQRINGFVKALLGDGQEVANELKGFGAKFKLPLAALSPLPTLKPMRWRG